MNAIYIPSNNEVVLNGVVGQVLRFSRSAGFGVIVTVMLFIFMCSLIAMDPPEIIEDPIKIIGVVMTDDRVIVDQPEPIEKKPVDPEPLPPLARITKSIESDGVEIPITIVLEPVVKGIDSGFSSGAAMAIFKVAPEYPRRSQSRGVEGFVDLMFDITPAGKTENIRVVYAEPEGAFERSSIKALAKWKYKPAMDDGVAMPQKNQTTRITYELEN